MCICFCSSGSGPSDKAHLDSSGSDSESEVTQTSHKTGNAGGGQTYASSAATALGFPAIGPSGPMVQSLNQSMYASGPSVLHDYQTL